MISEHQRFTVRTYGPKSAKSHMAPSKLDKKKMEIRRKIERINEKIQLREEFEL